MTSKGYPFWVALLLLSGRLKFRALMSTRPM